MRRIQLLPLILLAPCVGCCGDRTSHVSRAPSPRIEQNTAGGFALAPANASSGLLFDARPGPYTASDFNYRSDWPSTPAFYTPGEMIVYTQHTADYQGPGTPGNDWSYRRADSWRTSIGFR